MQETNPPGPRCLFLIILQGEEASPIISLQGCHEGHTKGWHKRFLAKRRQDFMRARAHSVHLRQLGRISPHQSGWSGRSTVTTVRCGCGTSNAIQCSPHPTDSH
eukprot:6474201-Amphidinium_carterae.2